MEQITAPDIQAYLSEQNFLTPKSLAKLTHTTPEKILELESAECIPVEGEVTVKSSFGSFQLPVSPERYYHPSIESWVIDALELVKYPN